ncbi:MAG: DNA polymerase III subunit beta [Minisyncoccia bacterium]|jgi:DNA polymerase-3 subunit beta
MKISILKNTLIDKITVVNRICPKKTDLSILNFFKLEAKDDKLTIFSTDLEISYKATLLAKVEEEGEFLIPAKQFYEVLQNFYEDVINIENKENTLILRGERTFSTLPGISEEEYPLIPKYSEEKYLEIDNKLFENYLEKIYGNIKTAEVIKPEFAGVYMWITENLIRLVTTDTIRLSEIKFKKDLVITNIEKEEKLLIPETIISEYLKIKKKPLKLRIYIEPSQVTFDLGDQVLLTKTLSIDYPDYQQVIPQDFNIIFYINRDEVLKALKLNKVYVDQTKEIKVKINPKNEMMELITKNEILGENINKVNINLESTDQEEEFEISYNIDFLIEGIKNVDSEKIFMGINIPSDYGIKPTLIKSPLEEDFIYILMPI